MPEQAVLTWLDVGGIVDDAISDAGSDDGLETLPALLGVSGEAGAQDQHAPSSELEYGLPPSIARALAHQVSAQPVSCLTCAIFGIM